jgi:cytochrome bd-type quinol oxidase subunit 1
LGLVATIIPVQRFFGHLTGEYVLRDQPAKFAAIEARWTTQQPATEVLLAIPDESAGRNLLAIEIPHLGSLIASGTWDAREIGALWRRSDVWLLGSCLDRRPIFETGRIAAFPGSLEAC